jgi:tetratricopeptide (TPR) repeat protein/2-polyprenyl-3-methyl-5-hydroxy-6-metoxy-1,4-benzoquinol methylase
VVTLSIRALSARVALMISNRLLGTKTSRNDFSAAVLTSVRLSLRVPLTVLYGLRGRKWNLGDNPERTTEGRFTTMNRANEAIDSSPSVTTQNPALAMIDKGNALEEQGRIAEAMAQYDAAVKADPRCARAHLNRGNILLADAQLDEARSAYQLAIACDAQYAAAHFNLGNLDYRAGEFEHALRSYQASVDIKPDFADAFVAMANALDSLGHSAQAVASYERALAINPNYAEAHLNLGVLAVNQRRHHDAASSLHRALEIRPDYASAHYYLGLASLGLGRSGEAIESLRTSVRIDPTMHHVHYSLGMILSNLHPNPQLEEAASSLRRATDIKPDFAQAHRNLGSVLTNLEQLGAAEASLRRALAIEPESSEILYDLVFILLLRGKSLEAVQLTLRSLEHSPTRAIKVAFANSVARTKFTVNDSQIGAMLTIAVREAWGTPGTLCRPALSLIMLNPRIARCVHLANRSWPARLPKATLFGLEGAAALAADPLLGAVLEVAPVITIEFERFLTCARHALLEIASSKQAPDSSDLAAMQFYASLARQCFINEYIFDFDDAERLAAAACRATLLELLDANAVIPPFLSLAVASYFPLHTLHGSSRLLAAEVPGPVEGVLRQQIREPLEEQALRAGIHSLTPISRGVSEDVRGQYEENPYPRWEKLPLRVQASRLNDDLRLSLPLAPFTPMPDDSAPEVLVAGCGTGSHPILVSQRFLGVRVLAIDLSLSSLSYAKRKTQELGITNIEYAQADILRLGGIERTFDVIESVGVLHHLADPFSGWRTLLSRLRPGGFMSLGFYSETARRHVVKAREFITVRGYKSTPDDIRRFRQDPALKDANAELHLLSESSDFFSMSECRDLLFHVQEHRLNLEQIESFVVEFGLKFIGFELEPGVTHRYHARFSDDPAGTNLRNWARFEVDNPDTFAAMYRFWIQQPTDATIE